MKQPGVLLCGADGFIGRHVETALHVRGHTVVRAVRTPRLPGNIVLAANTWLDT